MSVQLNRWLDITPITNVLRRTRGLLTVPAFNINVGWNSSFSVRAIQFNYSFSRNLGIIKTAGNYITDYQGISSLDSRLCWCIKNTLLYGNGSSLSVVTSSGGGNTIKTWNNLDPNLKYVMIAVHTGSNVISQGFIGAYQAQLVYGANANLYINGKLANTYAGVSNINQALLKQLDTNQVKRYKLNTNQEIVSDTPMYNNQKLLGSYVSLEGWTTPSLGITSNIIQNAVNLKTTALLDIDNRIGNDSSLGTYTAQVTVFSNNNPNSPDLLNLSLTYKTEVINGLAT